MKKLFVVAAAMLAFAFSANAQLGITAGVTSTSTDLKAAYADIAQTKSVTQYHAGIVGRIKLPLGFAIQPGLVYNMKGSSLESNLGKVTGASALNTVELDIDTKTGFIELPIQVQWGINLGDILRVYALCEPYVGYAITTESKAAAKNSVMQSMLEGADGTLAGLGIGSINSTDENKWDGRERLEYGVAAGAGVVILKHVGISAKYFWDMGNVYNDEGKSSLSAKAAYETTQNQKAGGIIASLTLYF